MVQWLKPPAPVRATSDTARGLLWLSAGFAALIAAAPGPAQQMSPGPAQPAAPGPAQLVLPAPLRDPRGIDFGADPVLGFAAGGRADGDFLTAIADAVARHPVTAEAAADTDAARAQRREVRAGLFPTLSASVVGSHSLVRDFSDSSAAVERLLPRGRTDASLGADQLLFDFGATGGRIASAAARLRAASADADRAANSVAVSAVAAWLQVIGYQALTELSDARISRHRAIVADTQARVDAGVGAGGDVARAEAGLADAIGDGARSARSLAAARAAYRELFGTAPPLHPQRPGFDAVFGGAAISADSAIAQSRRTPEVITADALADAASAEARAVRGDALPKLSAGIGATRFNVFQTGPNHDVRGQIVLRQTFSTGGAERARTSAADARARAAAAAADGARIAAARGAEAAFAEAHILGQSVGALADAYRANRRSRDIMAEQFRLSRGSLIDLLRTEDDYFAAARALVLGSIERDLAGVTLLARTGALLRHFAIPPAR